MLRGFCMPNMVKLTVLLLALTISLGSAKKKPTKEPPTTSSVTVKPTEETTPSCPANSHYNSSVSACAPTCNHLHGPPGCNESDSVAGCVCDEGYVLKEMACVPVKECGCMDLSGKKYHFGDAWYSTNCSKKCTCKKHGRVGRIECEEQKGCPGKAVCLQNNNGDYYCEKTDCSITDEYTTFDNLNYEFAGNLSYVLVQTKLTTNNLQSIYIEGTYGQVQVVEESSEEDSVEVEDLLIALKIIVYNHTVVLEPRNRSDVNGSKVELPLSPSPGLKIREHSSRLYLQTDFGLSVEFDARGKADIILPRVYKRKVGGLCGNFDGNKHNDFMKPNGTLTKSVQEFGESWRV